MSNFDFENLQQLTKPVMKYTNIKEVEKNYKQVHQTVKFDYSDFLLFTTIVVKDKDGNFWLYDRITYFDEDKLTDKYSNFSKEGIYYDDENTVTLMKVIPKVVKTVIFEREYREDF